MNSSAPAKHWTCTRQRFAGVAVTRLTQGPGTASFMQADCCLLASCKQCSRLLAKTCSPDHGNCRRLLYQTDSIHPSLRRHCQALLAAACKNQARCIRSLSRQPLPASAGDHCARRSVPFQWRDVLLQIAGNGMPDAVYELGSVLVAAAAWRQQRAAALCSGSSDGMPPETAISVRLKGRQSLAAPGSQPQLLCLLANSTRACVEHAVLYIGPYRPLPVGFAVVQACLLVTSCPSAAGLQAAAGGSGDVRVCAGHLCPAAGGSLPPARHAPPGQPLLCLPVSAATPVLALLLLLWLRRRGGEIAS